MSGRDLAKIGKFVTAGKLSDGAFLSSVGTSDATQYDSPGLLPSSEAGAIAFSVSNNSYYVNDSSIWNLWSFSTVNDSPSISSITFGDDWNLDSTTYYFDSDLTKTYTITINATDSDGLPLKHSLDSNTTFNQYATITFDNNVGTITLTDSSSETISYDLVARVRDAFTSAAETLPSIRYTRSLVVSILGTNWATASLKIEIQASDAEASDFFGKSVDIDSDYAVIGGDGEDAGGSSAGAAYVFHRSNGIWSQQAKLTADDAAASDQFGYAVTMAGNTVAVGAYGENTNGAVYIFTRSGSTWTQRQKITAATGPNGHPRRTNAQFGKSVDLSGNTLVVGEPVNANLQHFAYLYKRNPDSDGAQFLLQSRINQPVYNGIQPTDGVNGDNFATAVGVDSHDSSGLYTGTCVIGASNGPFGTGATAGGAFVYERNLADSWVWRATLDPGNDELTGASDLYGQSVSIVGNTIAIGSYQTDISQYNDDRDGAVFIWKRPGYYSGSAGNWDLQGKLITPDTTAGVNFFGYNVDLDRDDSDTLLVSEPRYSSLRGAIHVFQRSATDSWDPKVLLANPDNEDDNFGEGVDAIAINGSHAIVGAHFEDSAASNAGSAYIFQAGL